MKKSIILAVTAAALVMGMAGCKGISGNADDVDSTDKRNQSTTTLTGKADGTWYSSTSSMSGTFTRFYKEFGTSENVYESTCTITLTGSSSKTYFNSKYAAGFLFGIHTNKNKINNEKVYSAFCAAVRVKNGTPQYYVSHFSNYTDSELTSSTSGSLGTEDAKWAESAWTSLTTGNGYSYDDANDVLTVPVTVKDTTEGIITVTIGGSTVIIKPADYAAFGTNKDCKDADGNSIVDIEATQTKTKGCVIGKIASYGVIYPVPSTDTANVLNASWKVSDDAVTIGALFAAPEANN
jgi:hypothetical protein